MQDINNNVREELMQARLQGNMDVIEISYDSYGENNSSSDIERASLSWHLTTKEKRNVIENIKIESNQKAINELKKLIKSSSTP